eukprot:scaffold170613_cov22-Prasinocladus_malaysianus.AAC.1
MPVILCVAPFVLMKGRFRRLAAASTFSIGAIMRPHFHPNGRIYSLFPTNLSLYKPCCAHEDTRDETSGREGSTAGCVGAGG